MMMHSIALHSLQHLVLLKWTTEGSLLWQEWLKNNKFTPQSTPSEWIFEHRWANNGLQRLPCRYDENRIKKKVMGVMQSSVMDTLTILSWGTHQLQRSDQHRICGVDNLYTSARFFHEAYTGKIKFFVMKWLEWQKSGRRCPSMLFQKNRSKRHNKIN